MLRRHAKSGILCLALLFVIAGALPAASSPVTWHLYAANPVLRPTRGGWEDGSVNRPSVIKVGSQYRMYYDAQRWTPSAIGVATSADGITWQKRDDLNPVLSVDNWGGAGVGSPFVMKDGDTYKMWFDAAGWASGPTSIGYATSADGMAWTIQSPRIFTASQFGWDGSSVGNASVFKDETGYKMYYSGKSYTSQIGVATSPDGITWTRYISNPVVPITNSWETPGLVTPYVLRIDGVYHMWYGISWTGYLIHATSPDGFTWTKDQGMVVISDATAPWVIEEDGELKMWYHWQPSQYDIGIGFATTGAPPEPTSTPTLTPTATPTSRLFLPVIVKSIPYWTPTPTPSPTPTPGWRTIVKTTFEGGYPGFHSVWHAFDGNDIQMGEYYWGERNCRPLDGNGSGWAVGAGYHGAQLPCGSDYPDWASSWMVYGPFSLQGTTAADLHFNLWVNSERGVDGLCWLASVDNDHFYGYCGTGNSQGWTDRRLDLSNVPELGNLVGSTPVYVALAFVSDGSGHYPEGAYVDNVLLRECLTSYCPLDAGAPAATTDDLLTVPVYMSRPAAAENLPPPNTGAAPWVQLN